MDKRKFLVKRPLGEANPNRQSEQGAMLVEVLVATMVLLLVFTGVVQQVSNLASTRVRIETRDRAVSYVNSLHQIMGANGCGFDVDTVEEQTFTSPGTSDSFSGSDQQSLKGPWDRVQGCAFSAGERVRDQDESLRSNAYIDDNDVVHLSVNDDGSPSEDRIDKETAEKFCDVYGEPGSQYSERACELGDQTFTHKILVNDNGVTADLTVTVRYWFEIVGGTNGVVSEGIDRRSSCSDVMSIGKLPDTLARRVEVSFSNGKGGTENIVVTKRENVPVDSFQFASGTRVGVASLLGDEVSMYPSPGLNDPWKVTRTRESATACVWFPYISRHEAGSRQPAFSVDGSGTQEAPLEEIDVLTTGAL